MKFTTCRSERKAKLERAVDARQQGGRLGGAKFGELLPLIDVIVRSGEDSAMLAFLEALQARAGAHLYRREMFSARRLALKMKAAHQITSLSDAVLAVQNRTRHAGCRLENRSIGSTLLVKGLEFDRAIVLHANRMTRKDRYFALTSRAGEYALSHRR